MQQFNVGDWVENIRCVNQRIIKQVVCCKEHLDTLTVGNIANGVNVVLKSDVKLWQPKGGEFVIPKTKTKESFNVFKYSKEYKGFELEPFIGVLPSFIKAN